MIEISSKTPTMCISSQQTQTKPVPISVLQGKSSDYKRTRVYRDELRLDLSGLTAHGPDGPRPHTGCGEKSVRSNLSPINHELFKSYDPRRP
jgi:hypothetical protein